MVRGRRARRSRFTFSSDSAFLNGPAGTWTWSFADSIDVSFLPLDREEFSRLVAEGPKTFHRGDPGNTGVSAPSTRDRRPSARHEWPRCGYVETPRAPRTPGAWPG